MQVNTTYWLSEIELQVNKRELIFDNQDRTVYYAYCGINKKCWEYDTFKWYDIWHKAIKRYHRNERLTKKEHKEI